MNPDTLKKTIGRAEIVSFPELGIEDIAARIDTGAKTSAFWASRAELDDEGNLQVVFFAPEHQNYTGTVFTFDTFDSTVVASSSGHSQRRYKVQLLVRIKGKKIRAWFTLADRASQVYPVLIGRNVLTGKFVVDVKKGKVLKEEERRRSSELQSTEPLAVPTEEKKL